MRSTELNRIPYKNNTANGVEVEKHIEKHHKPNQRKKRFLSGGNISNLHTRARAQRKHTQGPRSKPESEDPMLFAVTVLLRPVFLTIAAMVSTY